MYPTDPIHYRGTRKYLWSCNIQTQCEGNVTEALMVFQIASRLGFRQLFHGRSLTGSHNFQHFFPYFTRSSLVWPTKTTPTIHNLKTALINRPKPFSFSMFKSIALAGLGVSLATWNKPAIRCEGMCA